MAQIVKFVYAIIIFLSLFHVAMNVEGKQFFVLFKFSYLLPT